MRDIDALTESFTTDRAHSFKIRGEAFRGHLGIDYEVITNYMSRIQNVDEGYRDSLNALLLSFMGPAEYERFDAWRSAQRDAGKPLTITEATLIGAAVVSEETNRPTRASSDSGAGRETNETSSTDASPSPVTPPVPTPSLSAVS